MSQELAGNLIVRNGKILLLYREDEEHWESQPSQGESCSTSNPEGYWRLPGGKVKENESPTETAIREAKEEIGVEVELQKLFYSGEFQHKDQIYLWHGYVATVVKGDPEIKEDKFEKLERFEGSELDELELASNLEMVLPALRKI